MPSKPFLSYSPKTTSINFPWPAEVTGLERIALSAQGGLQRVLSAFFARPISIALVYSFTSMFPSPSQPAVPLSLPNPSAIASASPSTPIIQTRQVHLQCSGKTVCTATATVRITSPKCARLFLEEKYAIGQMFTRLERVPDFELLSVGFGHVVDDDEEDRLLGAEVAIMRRGSFSQSPVERNQLWRKYKLAIEDFECDILEVFPDRDMFVAGTQWLDDKEDYFGTSLVATNLARLQGGTNWILFFGFLFLLAFEVWMVFAGRHAC